jgi:hypothetical protein
MPRQRKTTSAAITDAEQKIAGMKSIDDKLDLGNNVSVTQGETLLDETRTALENYNASLAVSDGLLNTFNEKERTLRAFSKKILPAGGLKYGTDSVEYEKLGGVRDSERKKPVRKTTTPQ